MPRFPPRKSPAFFGRIKKNEKPPFHPTRPESRAFELRRNLGDESV